MLTIHAKVKPPLRLLLVNGCLLNLVQEVLQLGHIVRGCHVVLPGGSVVLLLVGTVLLVHLGGRVDQLLRQEEETHFVGPLLGEWQSSIFLSVAKGHKAEGVKKVSFVL